VIAVDAQMGAADAGTVSPTAEQTLLRAVAADSMTARGQVVLVGLMRPLPTRLTVDGQPPPGAGFAVLEQNVAIVGADSGLRDVEDKWLVGTTGDQKNGFAAVYDVQVPGASAPMRLTYNPQWATSMEVYDWASGAFTTVTGQAGGDAATSIVALGSNQVRDGVVRVRMHEPRLSWASSVFVDAKR